MLVLSNGGMIEECVDSLIFFILLILRNDEGTTKMIDFSFSVEDSSQTYYMNIITNPRVVRSLPS